MLRNKYGGESLVKRFAALAAALLAVLFLVACSGQEAAIADGTYRAEYEDYDASGYKDFVEITFKDGMVVSIEADAVAEDGSFKSEAEGFRDTMQTICGTYPEKYYKDLINQYLEHPQSDQVDVVAGATATSQNFKALAGALEQAVRGGNTDTVVVKR